MNIILKNAIIACIISVAIIVIGYVCGNNGLICLTKAHPAYLVSAFGMIFAMSSFCLIWSDGQQQIANFIIGVMTVALGAVWYVFGLVASFSLIGAIGLYISYITIKNEKVKVHFIAISFAMCITCFSIRQITPPPIDTVVETFNYDNSENCTWHVTLQDVNHRHDHVLIVRGTKNKSTLIANKFVEAFNATSNSDPRFGNDEFAIRSITLYYVPKSEALKLGDLKNADFADMLNNTPHDTDERIATIIDCNVVIDRDTDFYRYIE